MKLTLKLIVICFIVLQPVYAKLQPRKVTLQGTEINNGGAGISINGKVATFYSAEMQVNPTPLKGMPSINALAGLIKKLYLPNNVGIELSDNVLPSFDRKYYAVTQESINQSTLQTIKEEYSKTTKTSAENITIFALTDPISKITLLLPDYFKLNEDEQVAILFHESLWINERVTSYKNMLEIEKDMQIYSMYPSDCNPRYNITKRIQRIFNEKLWALNTIFLCESGKYHRYTNAGSLIVADFLNPSEMDTFAKIILISYFNVPKNKQLYDLFSTQLSSSNSFKNFMGTKSAFLEALQDSSVTTSIIFNSPSLAFEWKNPVSEYNVKTFTDFLKENSKIPYGVMKYNLFEMNIYSENTSNNMEITLIYNPNKNKYDEEYAE